MADDKLSEEFELSPESVPGVVVTDTANTSAAGSRHAAGILDKASEARLGKAQTFSAGSGAAASDPRKLPVRAFTEGYDAAASYPTRMPVSSDGQILNKLGESEVDVVALG